MADNSPASSSSHEAEDFDDLEQMDFIRTIETCGTIKEGHSNRVVVIISRNFNATLPACKDRPRLFRFISKKCDEVAQRPYSILWMHTQATYQSNSPGIDFLVSCFTSSTHLPPHFRANLSSVVVLHPSLALWFGAMLTLPWMGGLWRKVHWAHRAEFLTDYWPSIPLRDTSVMPFFVFEHDQVLEDQPLSDYGTWVASREDLKAIGAPTPL